jgi:hypothetical protein
VVVWLAGCFLSATAPGPAARADPLPSALAPEPLHTSDEREFPPATVRAYQQVMEQGLSEFVGGRWAEARALFLRGHMLLPNARSSRVLGMTAFNLALYPAAVRELSRALGDPRRPLRGALREQTQQLLAQAEALVGRYRVLLQPSSAELRVDGLVTKLEQDGTLLVLAGQHLLEVEAPQYLALARTLLVDGRDDGVLVLRLQARATAAALTRAKMGSGALERTQPLASRPARRGWKDRTFADYRGTWALGAGTLALGAATLGVQLAAYDLSQALEARCRGDCRPWDESIERRDRLEGWGRGLLMTSLAFAATTMVLALVERDRARDRARENRKARFEPLREPL